MRQFSQLKLHQNCAWEPVQRVWHESSWNYNNYSILHGAAIKLKCPPRAANSRVRVETRWDESWRRERYARGHPINLHERKDIAILGAALRAQRETLHLPLPEHLPCAHPAAVYVHHQRGHHRHHSQLVHAGAVDQHGAAGISAAVRPEQLLAVNWQFAAILQWTSVARWSIYCPTAVPGESPGSIYGAR